MNGGPESVETWSTFNTYLPQNQSERTYQIEEVCYIPAVDIPEASQILLVGVL